MACKMSRALPGARQVGSFTNRLRLADSLKAQPGWASAGAPGPSITQAAPTSLSLGLCLDEQPVRLIQLYPVQAYLTLILGTLLITTVVILVVMYRSRVRAERALAVSEERLRLAVQNVPVMLWAYDREGNAIVWNRESERITGYQAGEIVGNPQALELIYPNPQVRARLLEKRKQSPGTVREWELPVACKDGSERIISMTNISAEFPVPGWASWGIGIDVTSRKQVEQQLRESREHYFRLVTMAQEGIVSVDVNELITFANPAFAKTLGFEPQELTGRSLFELCDASSKDKIAAETELRRQRTVSAYEVSLRTRGGELRDFLLSANPLLDPAGNYEGSLGIFTDITELKLTQDALRRSEEGYRQLVDTLPVGVLVVLAGRITFANPTAARLLGEATPEKLLGAQLVSYFPEAARKQWQALLDVKPGESSTFPAAELKLQGADGSVLDVEVQTIAVKIEHEAGLQILLTDIRERKGLLNMLVRQQKEESIATLAGGVAHDFNNILLGIIGSANLLSQSSHLPSEDLELCDVISTSAERMAALTKKLLAFARGGRVDPHQVDLGQVVDTALLMSRGALPDKLEIVLDLEPGIWTVMADPAQLEQVLINLIINAGEAMAANGGLLLIRASNQFRPESWQCSQHDLHPHGEYVAVTVSDTGEGMNEETQSRIFDPFFSTKFQGRGLGLAVASGIVKAHYGCLTVTSTLGKGSEFTLLLPRAEEPAHQPQGIPEPARGGTETILVIDDEEHVLRLASRMLTGHGYRVLAGRGAVQGRAVFQQQSSKIKLVLMDRGLRDAPAFETLKFIYSLKPSLPVIIYSGHPAAEALAGLESFQQIAYLAKPYKSADLLKLTRELLDQRVQSGS
jgi:two-component system, cell cycle sensor histidine kinase and response regulator CckA